jgi:hypothetical protein
LIDCRSRARNLGPGLCPAQNGADPASRKLESLSEVGPVLFLKNQGYRLFTICHE